MHINFYGSDPLVKLLIFYVGKNDINDLNIQLTKKTNFEMFYFQKNH